MTVFSRALMKSAGPTNADRALIECSPFPMIELEGERHILRQANALFCRLIGKSKDSIVGKPYAEVVSDGSSLDVLDRVYRSRACELHGELEKIQAQPAEWSYIAWPVIDDAELPLGVVLQVTGPTVLQRARDVNEALMISVVQQHERTDVAEALNVQLEAEIAERQRIEANLSKSEEKFRALVAMSSDWYWEQDVIFRFTELSQPTPTDAEYVPADYVGKSRWELPFGGIGQEQWDAHRDLLQQHLPFRNLEYQRVGPRGEAIWNSVNGDPVFDGAGCFCGYRGTGRDISEPKRHEQQIELIMREVSHRENNLLSLVMAVARQSAAANPDLFLERFAARLQSIAANQDLLIENRWEGIEIEALVRSQLAPLCDVVDLRIRLNGPALRLTRTHARSSAWSCMSLRRMP